MVIMRLHSTDRTNKASTITSRINADQVHNLASMQPAYGTLNVAKDGFFDWHNTLIISKGYEFLWIYDMLIYNKVEF